MQDAPKYRLSTNAKKELVLSGSSLAIATSLVVGQSAQAQTAPTVGVTDVQNSVNSLGTLANVTVPIVLVAFGVRLAIKLVNRMTVKG